MRDARNSANPPSEVADQSTASPAPMAVDSVSRRPDGGVLIPPPSTSCMRPPGGTGDVTVGPCGAKRIGELHTSTVSGRAPPVRGADGGPSRSPAEVSASVPVTGGRHRLSPRPTPGPLSGNIAAHPPGVAGRVRPDAHDAIRAADSATSVRSTCSIRPPRSGSEGSVAGVPVRREPACQFRARTHVELPVDP
jgi:hypothetical protein